MGPGQQVRRVVHAVDEEHGDELLARQSFALVLYAYVAPEQKADLVGFLERHLIPRSPGRPPPPVICVVADGDDLRLAQVLSQASSGAIFADQLLRPSGLDMVDALVERVNQKVLLQGAHQQLVHAEKFAAMGILAAEIAHEINNPASFVISNLSVMLDYIQSFVAFMGEVDDEIREHAPQLEEPVRRLSQEYDIAYMREDLDELLRRSLNGMQRIHQIVQDLRFFSHDTGAESGWVNVDRMLETTVSLVRFEAKTRARFELELAGETEVFSDANRLSQVFLNLLVNAIHAIEPGRVDENCVRVSTHRENDEVVVTISDTGVGMSREVQRQIFRPFFTTKPRGEGSGLGLSISQDIIQSLGGQILVHSEPGVGSSFELRLPVRGEGLDEDSASVDLPTDEAARDSGPERAPKGPAGSSGFQYPERDEEA